MILTASQKKLVRACCAVLVLACAIILVYVLTNGYARVIRLSDYTSLGRNANGEPSAVLDVDAILTDLRLPNPKYGNIDPADYPDVNALCNLKLVMIYQSKGENIILNVAGDLKTLRKYGISLRPAQWTQSLRGIIASDSVNAEPMTSPEPPEESVNFQTPHFESISRMNIGYLSAPVDLDGYGLNMRLVLEGARAERDGIVASAFHGAEAKTEKLAAVFIYSKVKKTFRNLYRAVYHSKALKTGAELWFTGELIDLEWTERSLVEYAGVKTQRFTSEQQARSLDAYSAGGYTVYYLDGSGLTDAARVPFDQNGFVRFPELPTSFRMPSGQLWSTSSASLDEARIWQLTGAGAYSMAKLLRYVRNEFGASTGQSFDPASEAEFLAHFSAQSWYEAKQDWTEYELSREQKENIRLLLEIEDLISN